MVKILVVKRNIAFGQKDVSNNDACAEMMRTVPTARTVPQIILAGRHIGGFEDLARHLQS